MPCSIAIIFFILSIFSTPTTTTSSSSALIDQACSTTRIGLDLKSCIQLLRSQPKVVSAKNPFDLSIQIIESGISRSKRVQKYMEILLKKSSSMDSKLKGVVQDCKSGYDAIIVSLKSALSEIKIKEYQTATYDLLVASTDDIQICERAMASKQIKDQMISSGNEKIQIFGFSALSVVEKL